LAAAVDAHIGFTVPARVGETLTASGCELNRSNRIGTYRVDVRHDDHELVAAFTDTVYITGRGHS
jgi:acyl-CoA thioesterase